MAPVEDADLTLGNWDLPLKRYMKPWHYQYVFVICITSAQVCSHPGLLMDR